MWIGDDDQPRRIAAVESGSRVPVVFLEGVGTREAAARLVGCHLEGAPRLAPEGGWFWDDLIGLRVEGSDGTAIGEVVEIFRAGGNEVYRVVGPDGERLVPALHSAVSRIDTDEGVMVLTDELPEEVR